jgi:hypothetical protein
MSAQPVDVLAVMDRAMPGLATRGELAEARAAVAELIEALRMADAWIREAKALGVRIPADNTIAANRAALARIGGGA